MSQGLLFAREPRRSFAADAVLFAGLALEIVPERALVDAVDEVIRGAPLRRMATPGGASMSVATTSAGAVGWVSDRGGYRYEPRDPASGARWPEIPRVLRALATEAARRDGYPRFAPDTCLVNRYEPGAKMGLHRDEDERDRDAPIVSVSLGLSATFVFGGVARHGPTVKVALVHGDVVVFGRASRLAYHGVLPVAPGVHPSFGAARINLTFRRAL